LGNIVYYTAASLDGFIAAPDDGVDWLFTEGDYGYEAFYASVTTLIMGRRTYEKILEFGPYPYHGKPSFVFSRRKQTNMNDIRFVDEPAVQFLEQLKIRTSGIIWLVGGGILASTLFDHALIDQMIVSYHPVYLGAGIPLSGTLSGPVNFTIEDQATYSSGLLQVVFGKPGSR
jgi:dihydrofolate reductase